MIPDTMPRGCSSVEAGSLLSSSCSDCNHAVGSHLFPTAVCVECLIVRLDDLETLLLRSQEIPG